MAYDEVLASWVGIAVAFARSERPKPPTRPRTPNRSGR